MMIERMPMTIASHQPKTKVHITLPIDRNQREDGEECNARLAFRTTERDFLYSAGFHIGRPKGCSLFIAYAQ